MLIMFALLSFALAFLASQYYRLMKTKQTSILELKRAVAKYEQILLAIGDAIVVVNLQGEVEMLNPVAEKLLEKSKAEAVGQHYQSIYQNKPASKSCHGVDPIGDLLTSHGLESSICRTHVLVTSKSGREFDVIDYITPLFDENQQLLAVLVVFRELTALEAKEARIAELTYRDSLTGLYNRTFFEREIPRLDHPAYWPLSVLFADLNGLKLTNDIFGHAVGDELLLKVAQVFLDVCRPEDRAFRWGGDEFIVLLPRTDDEEAQQIRNKLQSALAEHVVGSMKLTVPVGLGTKDDASQDIRIVIQQAEEEMYWQKTIGQGNYQAEALERILVLLHSKSKAEREHAERVQELATQFGKYLNLAPHELRRLSYAAFLHDIGKVALDQELLHKPFPLGPTEQHEMNRHPLVGFRLLNFFEETMDLASAVLAHHEHWDGNGYPKGLKGEAIPLLGRILAIVETYDRALHDPDAECYSPEQALKLIAEGAGKKFDPHLASAFLEMMQKQAAI